jgi:hypothetical protein
MIAESKITRVLNAVAAGTTNQNTLSVDMQNWDSVEFCALFGALTANQVTKVKAQQSSDDGSADDFSDIEGSATSALADTDTNKVARCEVARSGKRYVRGVVLRGTANAVIDGVIAIQRRARQVPISQSSTVAVTKSVAGAKEGTA